MIIDYFKGIWKLILIAILAILAIIFFVFFAMAYAAALFILAIVAILVLPYFVGRKDKPEKKDSYSLKKIK